MIYFISDTHFYHNNIIKYCNRPFNSVYDMNEAMINNWNDIVSDNDTIYHLGDFCLSNDKEMINIFNRLNGNKILIRGNHDRKPVWFYEKMGFTVLKNAPIMMEKEKLLLSHIPVVDKQIPKGYINLHGHIHNKKMGDDYPSNIYSEDKHINISVDVTNFKPVSIENINNMIRKSKK